jgi:asparagine synthase (glutamine-hydrolysing)
MCGIVGWLSCSGAQPVSSDVLARMRDRMIHRGPDGEGLWVDPSRNVGLGFRRLAIIDLSAEANQPMTNEDSTVQVVFNGEIYNHLALRRELLEKGHRFKTDHSDTEVIVHGYEEWGEAVVERLHGMFAIGVWDTAKRRLFLARDRIGIKPLYFTWIANGFLFASEIKSLLAHPAVEADVEPRSVYHYLSFLTTPAPLTMFRGIYKMPAGCRAFVQPDGTMESGVYWDALPGQGSDRSELLQLSGQTLGDYAVGRTRELFEAAVEKRLMSDVPFGVLLSGGIDSSANVAVMSKLMNRPVRTFTVGFSDHEHLNELGWARKVARHFGTDHHEIMVDEKAMREYLPSLVFSQDEPIADWVCIPLYFVSRLVRDSGTVVVQVGEGSDEQFSGYRSYMMHLDMYRRFWRPFSRVPRPARGAAAALARGLAGLTDTRDVYLDLIDRAGREREPFWSGATVYSEARKGRLFDRDRLDPLTVPAAMAGSGLLPEAFGQPDSYEIVRAFFDRLDKAAPGTDVLNRMIYSEFKLRLPELLLMRVDKIGMSVSIEPRVPFLDHPLVEFTMNLPQELKVGGAVAKSLFKQSVRGLLPDDVIDRPKMGFGAPMLQWLRGPFGEAVQAELESTRFFERVPIRRQVVLDMLERHRQERAEFSLYVWTVYNAVAWYDYWVDKSREVRVA